MEPGRQRHAVLPGHVGQGAVGGAAALFGIEGEVAVGIGAEKHLRQHDKLRPLCGGIGDKARRRAQVFFLIHRHGHLDQCKTHTKTFFLPR